MFLTSLLLHISRCLPTTTERRKACFGMCISTHPDEQRQEAALDDEPLEISWNVWSLRSLVAPFLVPSTRLKVALVLKFVRYAMVHFALTSPNGAYWRRLTSMAVRSLRLLRNDVHFRANQTKNRLPDFNSEEFQHPCFIGPTWLQHTSFYSVPWNTSSVIKCTMMLRKQKCVWMISLRQKHKTFLIPPYINRSSVGKIFLMWGGQN